MNVFRIFLWLISCTPTILSEESIKKKTTKSVSLGKYPWHANIHLRKNLTIICGASILSPNILISATECFYKENILRLNVSDFKISVGTIKADQTKKKKSSKFYKIEKFILSEQWSGFVEGLGSIVLLLTKKKIKFDHHISPIALFPIDVSKFLPGTKLKTVSWRCLNELGSLDTENHLKSEIIKFQPLSLCLYHYTSLKKKPTDAFCPQIGDYLFSWRDLGNGVIQGHKKDHSDNYLVGVMTSIKFNIQEENFITMVYENLNWIEDTINEYL